jgi:tetratricopeptide (TPR) repeat protein
VTVAGWRRRLGELSAGAPRWVLAGGGLLLLVVLGGGGWYWWSAYHAAASSQFSHASWLVQDALSSQARPEQVEVAVRALEEFIARYPRHALVPQAAYHLGNLRYQTKAYDLARDAYRLALEKRAAGSLGTLCRLGIGYSWEAQGNYKNALAAYQEEAARQGTKDFLHEETLLAVARTQEVLQQREQAIESYRRILRDLPQSGRAEEVRSRLASLEGSARR